MVFPEAVVEAEVDELEVLNTRQLRDRGKAMGVVPVGDGRTAIMYKLMVLNRTLYTPKHHRTTTIISIMPAKKKSSSKKGF
jgi:hypothetical protein